MKKAALIFGSIGVGAVCALLAPAEFILVPILTPFIACIVLAWVVAFQNKAVQITPFRLFFWPWVNITSGLQDSTAFRSLCACAGFAAGACVALLIQVASA